MPKKKATHKNKATGGYTVTAKVLGKVYTSKDSTILKALEKLSVGVARGVSVITVKYPNGDTRERIVNATQTQRLFNTAGTTKDVALKNISLLFEV